MTSRLDSFERDARVMRLYEQLLEIEQRLIPTGLHVFGAASELQEKADLLRMVASFDRPEQGARALPKLVAEALRIENYEELLQDPAPSERKEVIDAFVSQAVQECCEHGADDAANWLMSKAGVARERSLPTFLLLTKVSEQLEANTELNSLLRSLRGEYIEPGPGADIVQNPMVLPTGRNFYSVDPRSIPSTTAWMVGTDLARGVVDRYVREEGTIPESVGISIWGTAAAAFSGRSRMRRCRVVLRRRC